MYNGSKSSQIMLTTRRRSKNEEELEFLKTNRKTKIAEKWGWLQHRWPFNVNMMTPKRAGMLEARIACWGYSAKMPLSLMSNTSNEHHSAAFLVCQGWYVSNETGIFLKILSWVSNGINPRGVISDECHQSVNSYGKRRRWLRFTGVQGLTVLEIS